MEVVQEHTPKSSEGTVWSYLLAYSAWILSIALSGLLFFLLHSVIDQWYVVLDFNPWAHSAVSRFYFFFGVIVWLIFIYFDEHYFTTGIKMHRLGQRIIRVLAVLLVMLGAAALSLRMIAPFLGVSS